MALNLLKLCVGAESVEDQRVWSEHRLGEMRAAGQEVCLFHTTRMVPKRIDELLAGGSLYWVIKGSVQCRQKLLDIRPFVDTDGIRRCKLMLDSDIVATQWQPRRAFQGWRYLIQSDAPADLSAGQAAIPPQLRSELANWAFSKPGSQSCALTVITSFCRPFIAQTRYLCFPDNLLGLRRP